MAVIASALAGCTTTTRVAISPDELHSLAGIQPNERRTLTPMSNAETIVVTGDDVVRIGVAPDRTVRTTDEPWGKLYTLHWGNWVSISPTLAPGDPDFGPVRVPATDVTGGTLELTSHDKNKTTFLAFVIVVAAVSLAVVTVLVIADGTKQEPPIPLGRF